jgi:predicted NUDIX family phosphoesterase
MGEFLKAAYGVLKNHQRPLTAREITRLAIESSLLHTSGKTPFQTMKAKLSTEILQRGAESPFMRVNKGTFALREWKGVLSEHIADRYQKALFDEDILVFPEAALRNYIPGTGLYPGGFDRSQLQFDCRPMRRREAEQDSTVIQLVSVFVVRHDNKILTFKRTKRLPESRLHGFYSLAFGGHLNPDDLLPLLNIFDPQVGYPLLKRELYEELRLPSPDSLKIRYCGLLYDDSRPVSRQHLGVTYEILTNDDSFEIGERGFLMNAKYETIKEIGARLDEFENWSAILYREALGWALQEA